MVLVLSSCVPVAGALYRMAVPDSPEVFELSLDGENRLESRAQGAESVVVVLVLEVSQQSVEGPGPGLRYQAATRSGDGAPQRSAGVIDLREGGYPPGSFAPSEPRTITRRLPVIRVAHGEESVVVDVELRGDARNLLAARAELHRDPPRIAVSFVSAVVICTLGTLLVLIGAIQWARQVAAVEMGGNPGDSHVKDQRIWCMTCHLSALLGYVIPLAHVLAPLLVWASRRSAVPGVDEAGRESLNFQLTVSLFGLIGVVLSPVFIGLILLFAVVVLHVSMTLFAALAAQRGETVRYPVNLRII
jgi:uncharacterized Tic20 family protein